MLSHIEKSYIPPSFAYHFCTSSVTLLLFGKTRVDCMVQNVVFQCVGSELFPSGGWIKRSQWLSVDQPAVASLLDVLMCNVTVCTALLQLQMCKLACAFVLNLKSVFLRWSCYSVLRWLACIVRLFFMSASKGNTVWFVALLGSFNDFSVFKSFGLSTATTVIII